MQAVEGAAHGFTLMNRAHAEISGVIDVDCFNEEIIVLNTSMGTMTITGSGLNIANFSQEQGRLVVDGEVNSAEYSGRPKKSGGFLGRLLR